MNRKLLCMTGIVILIFLFSCDVVVENKTCSLTITLPAVNRAPGTRAPIYTRPGTYYARVYLLFNRELFRLGKDTDFIERKLSGDQRRETIEHIPAGYPYKLWLGVGTKEFNGDFDAFDVQFYAESEDFRLVADRENPVHVDLLESPFIKAQNLLGRYVGGAAAQGASPDNIYAATRTNVYRGTFDAAPDPDTLTMTMNPQSFSGYSINSLTEGYRYTGAGAPPACLYINTNRNVFTWDGGGSFSSAFIANLGQVNILRSLAYDDSDDNVCFFFQRNGGLGGIEWDQAVPARRDWVHVNYRRYFKGEIVHDFVVSDTANDSNVYFATAIGAFRIPESLIEDYDAEINPKVNLLRAAQFFKVRQGKKELHIYALCYDAVNNVMYLGTENGLWRIGIPSIIGGTPTLVPGTERNRIYIAKINIYRAYASKTYLFIQDNAGNLVHTYPFVAGLPGAVTSMDWDGNNLLISGTEGLVVLPL
jgi:hypothetical protein